MVDTAPVSWASCPSEEWFVEEIKSGMLVTQHKLSSSPYVTFGRAADAVDIPTSHESCSRLHARIAFDEMGRAWLKDMGSSHGTKVNKKSLPPQACGKDESDQQARGVMLFHGDIIQFGASTRIYCVNGPVQFDREIWKEEQAKKKAEAAASKAAEDARVADANSTSEHGLESAVSWGIDMDDHHAEGFEKSSSSLANLSSFRSSFKNRNGGSGMGEDIDVSLLSEKNKKKYEKLIAKKYKLSNLQKESDRIEAKEGMGDGLTAGQNAQLAKNREQEEILLTEIVEQERALSASLTGVNGNEHTTQTRKISSTEMAYNSFDDGEVEDRTGRKRQTTSSKISVAATEETLKSDWIDIIEKVKQIEKNIFHDQRKVEVLQMSVTACEEEDTDNFFAKNDLILASEALKDSSETKISLEKDLQVTEKMLHVLNENLIFDHKSGSIHNKSNFARPNEGNVQSMPPPKPGKNIRSTNTMSAPPPRKRALISSSSCAGSNKNASSDSIVMPAPSHPKKNMFSPSKPTLSSSSFDLMPPPLSINTTAADVERSRAKKRNMLLTASTLGTLANYSNESTEQKMFESETVHTKCASKDDVNKNVWKAPKDQSGDGKTKLNQRFAGRY